MSALTLPENAHVLIACEGAAEEVIVSKLIDSGRFFMPPDRVVDITRKRGARQIQENYLNYDYDWPVAILRILDSRNERFKLGNLYKDAFPVVNIYTRPEIEILQIINEGHYQAYTNGFQSSMKPSAYCVEHLKMSGIKEKGFLAGYWQADELVHSIREYKRLKRLDKDELCLADLIEENAAAALP